MVGFASFRGEGPRGVSMPALEPLGQERLGVRGSWCWWCVNGKAVATLTQRSRLPVVGPPLVLSHAHRVVPRALGWCDEARGNGDALIRRASPPPPPPPPTAACVGDPVGGDRQRRTAGVEGTACGADTAACAPFGLLCDTGSRACGREQRRRGGRTRGRREKGEQMARARRGRIIASPHYHPRSAEASKLPACSAGPYARPAWRRRVPGNDVRRGRPQNGSV